MTEAYAPYASKNSFDAYRKYWCENIFQKIMFSEVSRILQQIFRPLNSVVDYFIENEVYIPSPPSTPADLFQEGLILELNRQSEKERKKSERKNKSFNKENTNEQNKIY